MQLSARRTSLFFYGGLLVSLLTGLYKTKLIANGFGVATSGFIGQLSMVTAFGSTVAFFGLWATAARIIHNAHQEENSETISAVASLFYVVAVATMVIVVTVIGGGQWLLDILGLASLPGGVWSLAALICVSALYSFATVWWRARKQAIQFFGWTGLGCVVSTLMTQVASLQGNVTLAVMALIVTFGMPVIGWLCFDILKFARTNFFSLKFNASSVAFVTRGGGGGTLLQLSRMGSDVAARGIVVAQLGQAANGIVQPYYLYATVFMPQFIAVVQTQIIQATGLAEGKKQVESGIVQMVLSLVGFAAILTVLAPTFVRLFFSDEFSSGAGVLAMGGWSEINKWTGMVLAAVLIAGGNAAYVAIGAMLLSLGKVAMVYFLSGWLGVTSLAASSAIESFFFVSMCIFLIYRTGVLSRRSCIFLLIGSCEFFGASILTGVWYAYR